VCARASQIDAVTVPGSGVRRQGTQEQANRGKPRRARAISTRSRRKNAPIRSPADSSSSRASPPSGVTAPADWRGHPACGRSLRQPRSGPPRACVERDETRQERIAAACTRSGRIDREPPDAADASSSPATAA